AEKVVRGLIAEGGEALGVPASNVVLLSARAKVLTRVLTHGLEHPEAWLSAPPLVDGDQALVEQRAHPLDDVIPQVMSAYLLGSGQCPSAGEHREPCEQPLCGRVEKVVAPVDRRPQRPLALGAALRSRE